MKIETFKTAGMKNKNRLRWKKNDLYQNVIQNINFSEVRHFCTRIISSIQCQEYLFTFKIIKLSKKFR